MTDHKPQPETPNPMIREGSRASSNHAANLEGMDNTGAGRSQTTDSANLPAILNSAEGCPHGCKKESDCLRYDQGGSIPADCPLYAIPNSAECSTCGGRGWLPLHDDAFGPTRPCPDCADVTPNRVYEWEWHEMDGTVTAVRRTNTLKPPDGAGWFLRRA